MSVKWDWKPLSEHPGINQTEKATKAFLWARVKLQSYSPGPHIDVYPPYWTQWKAWAFYICSGDTTISNNWTLGITPAWFNVLEIEATHFAELPEPPMIDSN